METAGGLGSTAAGLFVGAIVFTVGDMAVSRLGYANRKDIGGEAQDASGLTIVLGALLDGIPESAVLGLTLLQTGEVGAAMLVAVFVSNVPEGIAATVGLRNGGWSAAKVYGLWTLIAVASAVAAGRGYAPARRRLAGRHRLHPRLRRRGHPDDAVDVDDARGLRARRSRRRPRHRARLHRRLRHQLVRSLTSRTARVRSVGGHGARGSRMAAMGSPVLPGRLGSPAMTLRDDPRADPRMIRAMEPFGMADPPAPAPVDATSPIEDLLEFAAGAEEGFEALFGALVADMPEVPNVDRSVEIIKGLDGNDVTVYVHRPVDVDRELPGVLHLHGGGMVLLEAAGAAYGRWRDSLAAAGMVVVGVEFRNGGGKHGAHAYPAGLDDCAAALRWVIDEQGRLGIGTLIVSGESGGGNLTLATILRAKRDGLIEQIDGAYAQCPYISNAWAAPLPELPSLVENDGYFLEVAMMGALARVYDPTGEHATDPLAWPLHATGDDLAGLPPHVISVNQLDPLRDEGLAYGRKLLDAGVSVVSRTVNGTCHAGDMIFAAAIPDVYQATIRDIKGFADSLGDA